ncbi:hypothetical protein [Serratia odorifera]|uniref:hypothetical protein n=1 Tax=Serratia odorifera TaxID=618 RepID=UPI00058804D2|nr:hypothetical protein [Serratia odorifera]PNK91163.1 hypothetical protein CEQ31_016455 [Serratia odorifera]RII72019.1 hypothetical protein DX901_09930 [Serratia odorifera]
MKASKLDKNSHHFNMSSMPPPQQTQQQQIAGIISKIVSAPHTSLERLKTGQVAAKANRVLGPDALLTRLTLDYLHNSENYHSTSQDKINKTIVQDILRIQGAVLSVSDDDLTTRGKSGEIITTKITKPKLLR